MSAFCRFLFFAFTLSLLDVSFALTLEEARRLFRGSKGVERELHPEMWECRPDPILELPSSFPKAASSWHLLSDDDRYRLLTRLGIPFVLELDAEWRITCLADLLVLLREEFAMCFRYSSPSIQELFFLVHPEEREIWYGTERLEELHLYLDIPSSWKRVMEDRFHYRPDMREAEEEIASLGKHDARGPAILPVIQFFGIRGYISLADITLEWERNKKERKMKGPLGHGGPSGLKLNMGQNWRRRGEQLRVQQKLQYQEGIDELNSIVKKATQAFPDVMAKAIHKLEKKWKEQQESRKMLRDLHEHQKLLRAREREAAIQAQQYAAQMQVQDHAKEEFRQQQIACYHLFRVSQTLKIPFHTLHSVRETRKGNEGLKDDRYGVYVRLLQRNRCNDGFVFEEETEADKPPEKEIQKEWRKNTLEHPLGFYEFAQQWSDEAKREKEREMRRRMESGNPRANFTKSPKVPRYLLPAALLLWEHIRQFYAWHQETGYTHTISQSFVLFYALYVVHQPENAEYLSSLESEDHVQASIAVLIQNVLPFQPQDFLTFTAHLVRQGAYLQQLEVYLTKHFPVSTTAELWYFLATLELFHSSSEVVSKEGDPREGGTHHALGVLHLYQAVWYGSRHATTAMATLRELGLFLAQHDAVAARLLYLVTLDSASDILYQLLRRQANRERLIEDKKMCIVKTAQHSALPTRRAIFYSSSTIRSIGAEGSPSMLSDPKHSLGASSGGATAVEVDSLSLNHLLRHGRLFDGLSGAWYTVDHPYFTKESMDAFLAASLEVNEDEDYEDDEEASTKSELLFFQAIVLLSGAHDIPRNLKQAECLLLSLLREMGFFCDITTSSYDVFIQREWNTVCSQHSKALQRKESSIPCGWKNLVPFPDSFQESTYVTLEKTLFWLSFLYMIQQKPELSSFYAMMAVDLSHIVYSSAQTVLEEHNAKQRNVTHTNNSTASLGRFPWYVTRMMSKEKVNDGSGKGGREGSEGISPWLMESSAVPRPFRRSLVFMAVAEVMAVVDHEKWCVVDAIVRETLRSGFGASLEEEVKEEAKKEEEEKEPWPTSLVQGFMLLLSAAGEKLSDPNASKSKGEVLHQNSVEGTDPFFVLVWLIRYISSSPAYSHRLSPTGLLGLSKAYLPVLGAAGQALLPRPSDDWITFGCRVSDAASKARSYEVVSLAFQLQLNCGMAQLPPSKNSIGYVFNEKFSESTYLRLRREAVFRIRPPRIQPSFFAHDINMFLQGSSYSSISQLWDFAINKISSFFTKTRSEVLLEKFGRSVLPSFLPRGRNPPFSSPQLNFPYSTRDIFLQSFDTSKSIRHFSSGLFLFSTALEVGSSQGFSLLFYAADEGENSYLWPLATTLGRDVWGGPTVVSMWREEHLASQWQQEMRRKNKKPHSYVFSLDHHTPFYYAFQESRQELMSRINIWNAKRMFAAFKKSLADHAGVTVSALPADPFLIEYSRTKRRKEGGNEVQVQGHTSEELFQKIREQLLLCTSYIGYLNAIEKKPCRNCTRNGAHQDDIHASSSYVVTTAHSPYAGTIFPAADIDCLQELLLERVVVLTPAEREQYTTYLEDLVDRILIYYRVSKEDDKSSEALDVAGDKYCDFRDAVVEPAESGEISEPYFLVEPWNRHDLKAWSRLRLGEGVFFNRRLHRLSGTRIGGKFLQIRNKFCRLFSLC